MKQSHTPGPWLASCADEWSTAKGEHAQFGRYDISAGSVDPAAENYYRIASVSNVNNALANKENARLIAAAPELLEALQASVALADENKRRAEADGRTVVRSPEMQAVYDRCVAAIAKATGSAA